MGVFFQNVTWGVPGATDRKSFLPCHATKAHTHTHTQIGIVSVLAVHSNFSTITTRYITNANKDMLKCCMHEKCTVRSTHALIARIAPVQQCISWCSFCLFRNCKKNHSWAFSRKFAAPSPEALYHLYHGVLFVLWSC